MDKSNTFEINARTCTLKYNSQKGGAIILNPGKKYEIPIFQRPYSWGEEQVRKFISDIFIAFWGNDGSAPPEPMFVGTMQISLENKHNVQEIIDGQQRLTTLLILLKVLKTGFPESSVLSDVHLDWLSTKVNNGIQQAFLNELVNSDLEMVSETTNPYLRNSLIVKELFREHTSSEEGDEFPFDLDKFLEHLFSNVYFVVIETRAGLSKTLQIFDAINTTGLDLNGGDIFKLRMYEYLRKQQGRDESAFSEISALYEKIDKQNAELKHSVTEIPEILNIYQHLLISRYNLPVALYSYGVDTFFDQLFDTILRINPWEHFRNRIEKVELSVSDIDQLIDARYEWEAKWYVTAEDMGCYKLIEQSRYGRFVDLIPVILMSTGQQEHRFEVMRLLARVYFIYSIRFQKSIYDVQNWTYDLLKIIVQKAPIEQVLEKIRDKIGTEASHNPGYGDLNWFLAECLTENAKRKTLICRLSAMLEEDFRSADEKKIDQLEKSLFSSPIDIEHIQSYHHKNGEIRKDIWAEWKENINSIGNLVILEQDINRSISNNLYEEKVPRYLKSQFSIVNSHPQKFITWDLQNCLTRKESERQKLLDYLFSHV